MPLYNLGFNSNKIFDDKMIYAKGMSVLYFKFLKILVHLKANLNS